MQTHRFSPSTKPAHAGAASLKAVSGSPGRISGYWDGKRLHHRSMGVSGQRGLHVILACKEEVRRAA